MIRAFFSRCAIAVAALTAAVNVAPAQFFENYEYADYRGGDEVILDTPVGAITEKDLFVWVLLTGADFSVEEVIEWKELEEDRAVKLLDILEEIVRARLIFQKSDGYLQDEPDFLARGTRLFAGPAAMWIWADTVVRSEIRLFPEDYLFYYMENKSDFGDPERVLLRRLRISLPITATIEEQNRARTRAEALRREAFEVGSLEPLLERDRSLLVDPPGELFVVTKEDPDDEDKDEDAEPMDPQIVDIAFRMVPGQISAVFRGDGGFYIVECVDRLEEDPVNVLRVREEIREELYKQFLPQQFEYLAGKRIFWAFPDNNARIYSFIDSSAKIFAVNKFGITLEEFDRIYTFAAGPDIDKPNLEYINFLVERGILGEVVTQELEKKGLIRDRFYQEMLPTARRFFEGSVYMGDIRSNILPHPDVIEAYIEENKEKLAPENVKAVWRLELAPRNRTNLGRSEVDSLKMLIQSYAPPFISSLTRQIEERALVSGDSAYANPLTVFTPAQKPDPLRVQTTMTFLGLIFPTDATDQLEVSYEDLQLGRFTAPRGRRDGSVVSYYVGNLVDIEDVEEDEIYERGRIFYVIEESDKEFDDQIDEMREAGGFRFSDDFPMEDATERPRTYRNRLVEAPRD